ncbi:helix-turn-helix domain-containing protein [Nocardiopsis potens]|uniref:helix-turn-helix domain-containing protein n=1 Tax=Nocardiopsis potens TaxID=1246458 RepID=UPI000344A7F0
MDRGGTGGPGLFRAETGLSPSRRLLLRRLDPARELPESTALPVERIAARAGLGTAASLRAHFNAELGVSSTAYRRTFRGATPAPGRR